MVEEIAEFATAHKGIEMIDIFLMDEEIARFFSREIKQMKRGS
jgi:hypothetical protein